MRRAGGYSEDEKLDQLYDNLQLHIRREEVRTIDELSRVARIEAIQQRKHERQPEASGAKSKPRRLLLALQTARAYQTVLSTPAGEILLSLRERLGPYPRLPPTTGKRIAGRRQSRRRPARLRIKYTPRPHVPVRIRGRTLWALLDSGSEISCLDIATANEIQANNNPAEERIINLADGSEVVVRTTVKLTITVGGMRLRHQFAVLPQATSPVLNRK